ncbi:MAG: cytochrome b562 [Planctomycetota bacterium]|nr:cytochrome b562 [Planctomycetota bacterium]
MTCTSIRALTLLLVLPLSGWFVVSSMTPASVQDPKPAPEAKGEPREGQRPEGRRQGRGPGGGPSLHGAMEQMGNEMKRVSESIADPAKNEATLQGLGRMLMAAGASQNGEPKNLAEIPADKQAAHKLAFRRALVVLARDIADIELLVLDGKNAAAAEMLESKVVAGRDSSHEKFGGDEDKEH